MHRIGILASLLTVTLTYSARSAPRSHGLPATDLKVQVIWGSTCELPDGSGLAFGGQDQKADDGSPHTRIKAASGWQAIHLELRQRNPLQKLHTDCAALARQQKDILAHVRGDYLRGNSRTEHHVLAENMLRERLGKLRDMMKAKAAQLKGYDQDQLQRAQRELEALDDKMQALVRGLKEGPTAERIGALRQVQIGLETAAEALDAEPPARALSPLVFDDKTKQYVLFGGDHLDYLTNDTWTFDPAKQQWRQRHPKTAPPPRGKHTLRAANDGKIVLQGGYTYSSNTDYCGGQYRDLDDGDWTYDIAADSWTGTKDGSAVDQRTYRTGPFQPEFYVAGAKPEPAVVGDMLKTLPANTWTSLKPPALPRLNRDWGTAVLDPDRDLILRFSGGHSAHGGSDVLHYHLGTNRWELPFPVEFPLGQLYSNTSYPDGHNFNQRPWITGHTYRNYGYDTVSKKMYFVGRTRNCYIYEPGAADWIGRFPKPPGMVYGGCFYTLNLCTTPHGLYAWTASGRVFQLDRAGKEWSELKCTGEKLAGSVVDSSGMVYDSRRDRFLFVAKGYGDKSRFDGRIFAVDRKTGAVSILEPEGREFAAGIPFLRECVYYSEHDLVLFGSTMPAEGNGLRRTPAYDAAGKRWVTLKIGGVSPVSKTGRDVSLGLMYDAKRKLVWAVDTSSNVFVVRLDPGNADVQPLR